MQALAKFLTVVISDRYAFQLSLVPLRSRDVDKSHLVRFLRSEDFIRHVYRAIDEKRRFIAARKLCTNKR